jgi:hypothetical protein
MGGCVVIGHSPFDTPVLSKPFTLREPQGERWVEGIRSLRLATETNG